MWVEGRCILAHVELSALSPSELYSLLMVMWMDYIHVDSELSQARGQFIRSMMESVVEDNFVEAEAPVDDPNGGNPFPGVMRTGPSGPAVQAKA